MERSLHGTELKARCRRNPAECREGPVLHRAQGSRLPGLRQCPRPHGQPSRRETDGGRTGENGGATRFLSGGMAVAKAQPKRRKPAQVSLYGSAPPARLPAKEYGYANVDASPETMCRKHLLGEHVELHMLLGSLRRGKTLTGSSPGSWWTPAHVPAARRACARNGAARLQARVAAG